MFNLAAQPLTVGRFSSLHFGNHYISPSIPRLTQPVGQTFARHNRTAQPLPEIAASCSVCFVHICDSKYAACRGRCHAQPCRPQRHRCPCRRLCVIGHFKSCGRKHRHHRNHVSVPGAHANVCRLRRCRAFCHLVRIGQCHADGGIVYGQGSASPRA